MIVMTMMVRDEADIIAATIEHHLAQGIDHIIVTDNASVDGTREILEEYAQHAPLTVHDDPEHRKQQARVVTAMAREAHALGADWVINGDADEFVRARSGGETVADVLAQLPTSIGELRLPVVNLVGRIASRGAGIERLILRDERSLEQLAASGIPSHPTPNAIHVGSPDVDVVQGNHSTSIGVQGEAPAGLSLEVLHLPWRSTGQVERKTRNMGLGYDESPDARPSANHHGMRDWRRQRAGVLLPFLALRMPTSAELATDGFVADRWLGERLAALTPVRPALLADALAPSTPYADDEIAALRETARILQPLDVVAHDDVARERARSEELAVELERVVADRQSIAWHRERDLAELAEVRADVEASRAEAEGLQAQVEALRAEVEAYASHPAMRTIGRIKGALHRD